MSIVSEILTTATPEDIGFALLWGQVISVSPTEVRIAGDTGDTEVPLSLASYTATTSDKVLLTRIGTTLIVLGKIA